MAFQATVSFQVTPIDDRTYAGQTISFAPVRNDVLRFVAGTGPGTANSVAYRRGEISSAITVNLQQCIDPLNVTDANTYCNFTEVRAIYIHNESATATLMVSTGVTYPAIFLNNTLFHVGPGDSFMLSNYVSGWALSSSANEIILAPDGGGLTYVIVLIGTA